MKHHTSILKSVSVLAVFVLGACSNLSDPHYSKPEITTISEWHQVSMQKSGKVVQVPERIADHAWWGVFHDSVLNGLMDKALQNSHALRIAEARVAEADAEVKFSDVQLMPKVDGVGSITRGRSGPNSGDIDTVSRLGAQGAWDLDFAGGNKRNLEAARAEAEAARAERDKTRSDLLADVAVAYIRYLSAQRQRALTLSNLDAQQNSFTAVEAQRDEGAVSDLEFTRARAQVETTRARLPQLDTDMTIALNKLSLLVGLQPGEEDILAGARKTIPSVPESVVIETPLATVAQRPDIIAAERRLARDTALKGSASAEVFPTLSLGGFFGIENSRNAGSFGPWNIAGNALAPLLNFGRIKSRIEAASAREVQAYHTYRQTVLVGLSDVDNALASYINEQRRLKALEVAANDQTTSLHIASEQYKAGTITQLDLLVAEQNRLNADVAMAQSQGLAAENLVELYRAMGWGAGADASVPQPRVAEEIAPEQAEVAVVLQNAARMQPIIE